VPPCRIFALIIKKKGGFVKKGSMLSPQQCSLWKSAGETDEYVNHIFPFLSKNVEKRRIASKKKSEKNVDKLLLFRLNLP